MMVKPETTHARRIADYIITSHQFTPKRVLITGGAGFIGHHVVEYFLRYTNYNMVCLDRLDYSGNLNRLHEMIKDGGGDANGRVKFVYHDLKAELNGYTKKQIGKVDYIIHMAAQSHVDRSIEFPLEFVADNVVGTANILNYAREIEDLKMFIYFSTDEIFGPAPMGVNYTEYARYNSTNPYSATKAAAEELTVAFHNTYGIPCIITHTMNVFGRRQHPEKFIPSTIRNVLKGKMVTIHSDPTKTIPGSRYYIYADYVADALDFLMRSDPNVIMSQKTEDEYGAAKIQKYNIVGNRELNNLELAEMIAGFVGKPLKYNLVDFHSARPGHDLRYALSGEKMKNLGWQPWATIESGIQNTVEWYLKNPAWLFE